MTSYKIFIDGAIDLLESDHLNPHVRIIPMTIQLEDQTLSIRGAFQKEGMEDFYQTLDQGQIPTTSMINSYTYEQAFREALLEGKDLIYISLSGAITSTLGQSQMAARILAEDFPQKKILCLDSLSATYSGGFLVHRALENLKEGYSIEDNYRDLIDFRPSTLAFGLPIDLSYLQKGGRLSAASAFFGGALQIKPIVYLNKEGGLVPLSKKRGLKQALKEICQWQVSHGNPANPYAVVSHCQNPKAAEDLQNLLYQETNLTSVDILPMSPIIASHLGPGSLIFSSLGQRP